MSVEYEDRENRAIAEASFLVGVGSFHDYLLLLNSPQRNDHRLKLDEIASFD
jgi:hypothetical protein